MSNAFINSELYPFSRNEAPWYDLYVLSYFNFSLFSLVFSFLRSFVTACKFLSFTVSFFHSLYINIYIFLNLSYLTLFCSVFIQIVLFLCKICPYHFYTFCELGNGSPDPWLYPRARTNGVKAGRRDLKEKKT